MVIEVLVALCMASSFIAVLYSIYSMICILA